MFQNCCIHILSIGALKLIKINGLTKNIPDSQPAGKVL